MDIVFSTLVTLSLSVPLGWFFMNAIRRLGMHPAWMVLAIVVGMLMGAGVGRVFNPG